MIFDKIENLKNYAGLASEVFEKITAFLAGISAETEDGRTELMGNDLYAMVQRYNTHLFDADKLETHTKYIDIQLLLAGEEVIYYGYADGLPVTSPYNDEKDYAFYRADKENLTPLALNDSNFAVFLPEEGHAPGCGDPDKGVVKVVIKIRRTLLGI